MNRSLTAFVCLATLAGCSSKPVETTDPARPLTTHTKTLDEARRLAASRTSRTFEVGEGSLRAKTALGGALETREGRVTFAFGKNGGGALLGLVEVGRADHMVATDEASFSLGCTASAGDDCIERRPTETLVEWWHNEPDKLEQSFRLERAPEGTGLVRLRMAVDFAEIAVHENGTGVEIRPVYGPALVYDALLVKDAAGTEVPARFEAAPNGVDIVFSDVNAAYPIVVDPTVSKKATQRSWEGKDTGAFGEFGWSVASAGDVNGDGFDDVLVGTGDVRTDRLAYPNYVSGRIFLFLGGPSGPTQASWTAGWNGFHGGEGATAIGIGDIDGDSYADIAAFGHFGNGDENQRGTSIYLGSKGGLRKSPAAFLSRQIAYPLGDLDGDGKSDVGIVSLDDATVRVRYGGAATGLDARSLDLVVPCSPACQPGATYANPQYQDPRATELTHGDFDGDGKQDIAIGVPMAGNAEEGAVYIYMNGPNGIGKTPSKVLVGSLPGAHFGTSVQYARDVDGDGHGDLLVAARPDMYTASAPGASVYLFQGAASGLQDVSAWKLGGLHGLGYRGPGLSYVTVMAGVGDVDGDGFADVAIGAPEEPNSRGGTGKVLVFRGSSTGLPATPDIVSELEDNAGGIAPRPAIFLGHAVAAAGDVDGDGFADYLQSADGYSTGGQVGRFGGTSNGGLVCLNGCAGARAPANNLFRRTDSGCVVRSAHARSADADETRACTACTASQTQNCGFFKAACDDAIGGCAACDGNLGDATSAPCRSASKPICSLTGPNKGACRAACDGNFGAKTSNACTSVVPFCERSGPDAGRCMACDGDFGATAPHACASNRPQCVTSGPTKGLCQARPKSGGTKQSVDAPGVGGAVTRTIRRLKGWWAKL